MSNGTGLQRRPMVVKPAVISCSGHYCRKAKVVVDGGKGYEDSQAKAKERQRAEVEAFPDRHIIRPFQPQIREHDEKERRREDRGKAGQVSTAEEKPGNERVTANEREVDSGEQEEDSQRVREVPYTAVGGGPPVHSPEDEENRERNLCRDALFQANEEAVDAFLRGHTTFTAIVDTIARVLDDAHAWRAAPGSVEDVLAAEQWARAHARERLDALAGTGRD